MPKKRAVVPTTINPGELVLVHWEDACTTGRWHNKEHYAAVRPWIVKSVGWVVIDTAEFITIIQSVSDDSMTDGLTVPRSCVKSVEVLA